MRDPDVLVYSEPYPHNHPWRVRGLAAARAVIVPTTEAGRQYLQLRGLLPGPDGRVRLALARGLTVSEVVWNLRAGTHGLAVQMILHPPRVALGA